MRLLLFYVLFTFGSSVIGFSQNNKQYSHKADEFIKYFIAEINLILDPESSYEERLITKNVILDDMIVSREETQLYDNISDREVINNYLGAQTYLDRLFIRFNNQMPLKNINGNFINFQFGNFYSDSNYVSENKVDRICVISRIINLDSVPINRALRTDTISFVVVFHKGDLNNRRILSTFKYVSPAKIIPLKELDSFKLGNRKLELHEISDIQVKNKPVENQVKLLENGNMQNPTFILAVNFNYNELMAMNSKSFDLYYYNMNISTVPELKNLETILFSINFNSSTRVTASIKQLVFKDESVVNLENVNNDLVFDIDKNDINSEYIINLSEQSELRSFLKMNNK